MPGWPLRRDGRLCWMDVMWRAEVVGSCSLVSRMASGGHSIAYCSIWLFVPLWAGHGFGVCLAFQGVGQVDSRRQCRIRSTDSTAKLSCKWFRVPGDMAMWSRGKPIRGTSWLRKVALNAHRSRHHGRKCGRGVATKRLGACPSPSKDPQRSQGLAQHFPSSLLTRSKTGSPATGETAGNSPRLTRHHLREENRETAPN
jgi:hypothetical protein